MKKLAVLGLAIAVSAITLQAQAEEKKPKAEFNPAASVQLGAGAFEVKAGLGQWENNSHSMIYVSHFQSDDTTYVDGTDIGKTKYSSTRLGVEVNSYRTGKAKDSALRGGLFVYKNDSDLNIDRYGVGLSLSPAVMLGDKIQVYAGLDLMPEFLSTDWDAEALLEYEAHAGVSFRATPNVDVGVNYRIGRTLDSTSVGFYSLPMLEVSLRM
ncbi:MAG: hypothetical protein WAO12_06470 [Venatoribacter sp.]